MENYYFNSHIGQDETEEQQSTVGRITISVQTRDKMKLNGYS